MCAKSFKSFVNFAPSCLRVEIKVSKRCDRAFDSEKVAEAGFCELL